MNKQDKIQWCIKQHSDTNHFYDEYLPYEFHLRMVVNVFNQFKQLIENECEGDIDSILEYIELACWGHDIIEDTRTNYNGVKQELGEYCAEIIRAVTNYGRGRDRNERMPDFVYDDIKNTYGAIFVKLCDRIANVQYSKMTGSRMFEMYKKENDMFVVQLGWDRKESYPYGEMFRYLNNLFND